MNQEQSVTLQFDIDGRAVPVKKVITVPACGSYVEGVHAIPEIGLPAQTAYYRVVAYFPGPGMGQLIIRALPTFDSAPPILPPPQVLR